MKLPIPSLFAKKDASNYYLSLLLRDEKAVAIVLQEVEGKLKVIGKSETSFSKSLEEVPYEELLESLDKAISRAEEPLPPNMETEKTVFGVKDSWVEEKKIKKEYLSTLKKLCDALSLQPIGFMVVSEAISHLLTQDEGAPLSAILAEIHNGQANLTLFRAGRVIEAHSAPIADSIPQTVDKLLHHFTIDVLPSRIIVFDGGDGEKLAQEFITHHWSKSIPFLHVPQISVLPDGYDNKAMVYGTAEQMGFSVLNAFTDMKAITIDAEGEKEHEKKDDHKHKKTEDKKEKDEKAEEKEVSEGKEEKAEEAKEQASTEDKPLQGDNFGFVIGGDIAATMPHHTPSTAHKNETKPAFATSHTPAFAKEHTPEKAFATDEEEKSTGGGLLAFLSPILGALSLGKVFVRVPSVPFGKRMLIIPALLLIIVGLIAAYIMTLKATVTLHMQTKDVTESTPITLKTNAGNDLSQKILASKEVETSQDGTVSTDTTGKKDVGEKAKGTVTLYNNSDAKKTIPAGTTITSSNDLDFVTDKEVVIASASGEAISPKPGTASVGVTAKQIGSEYNLPSNTKFSLSGISTNILAGKNDSAFSGGSKKTVTVVAKKDIDKLTSDLPKSLEGKAREAIKDRASSDQAILPEFTDVTVSKKSFDNDLGDEAKKITLKGTVTFTTLSYSTSDLKELAQATLKGKFSQDDLSISDKGITAELTDIKPDKSGGATATLEMSAGLLPKLDKQTIINDLTGKSFSDAEEYLSRIPQVKSADITLSPNIPLLPKLLPRLSKNISVSLKTND